MKNNKAQSIGNPLALRIISKLYPVLERTFPWLAYRLSYQLFFTPIKYKTPERELDVIGKAERFTYPIQKKRTQFYSWGNSNNPLIVVVHGWMGRTSQFYKLIEKLVSNNYHVVGFDGPAHGASAGRQTGVFEFVEAINHIIDKYGKIHWAIGHSFGGVALVNAISKGSEIENLALIATPSIASDLVKQFEEKINASPAAGVNFQKKILNKYGYSFEAMSTSELIKTIKVAQLVLVHDEQDKDVPIEHSYLLKRLYPEAITYFTNGLGHTRILRNDEVINHINILLTGTQERIMQPK